LVQVARIRNGARSCRIYSERSAIEEPVATGARTSGTSSSARRRKIAAVSAR
jgi:hypothetical protein